MNAMIIIFQTCFSARRELFHIGPGAELPSLAANDYGPYVGT